MAAPASAAVFVVDDLTGDVIDEAHAVRLDGNVVEARPDGLRGTPRVARDA